MTLTYLILAHGEEEVFMLVDFVRSKKAEGDRIMILFDPKGIDEEYATRLRQCPGRVIIHSLEGDYSAHRNIALNNIRTDYCFALDADERPADELIENIHKLIEAEPDLIWVPRANYLDGMLPIRALEYGWQITDGMVNWPDPQTRIFRMRKGIRWVGKLHERLKAPDGSRVIHLPHNPRCAIIHRKSLAKLLSQNEQYAKQFSEKDNSGEATVEALKQ